jgi:hypothetical protein
LKSWGILDFQKKPHKPNWHGRCDENHIMSNNQSPSSAEEAGLSPTPTDGLSEDGNKTRGLFSGLNDPNASAMNENGDAALARQLTGEIPGDESTENPGGLPSPQNPQFQEGT